MGNKLVVTTYPWSDGKLDIERQRRRTSAKTPFFAKPCASKIANAFVWPIYAAFRFLLTEDKEGHVMFQTDPLELYNDKKAELVTAVRNFHQNQAHGITHQVGRDKEIWLRLESQIEFELKLRERLRAATK
jgi:hypothetical protein